MEYITVKEMAELKGCSEQYVKKIIKDGKIEAEQVVNDKNRPKYLIPISALPENLQNKYYGQLMNEAQVVLPKPEKIKDKPAIVKHRIAVRKEFGQFNANEREQITFWSDLLQEWRIRREEYENYAEGDMCFIAETKRLKREYLANNGITLSKDILYRKYKAWKENDLQGLVDNRGGWNKGKSSIPKPVLETFFNLYLCDAELPVRDCYKSTLTWTEENYPEYLPSMATERTFRREADKLPVAIVKFFRKSQKECIDECFANIAGMTTDAFKQLWNTDAASAVTAFIGNLNNVEEHGRSAVQILDEMGMTEVRLSNTLLSLASSGDLMTRAISLSNTAWDENTALMNEVEKRYATTESIMNMTKNNIVDVGITVYDKFQEPLVTAFETATER